MLELPRFHGIVVRRYHRDHAPAHFHAESGDFEGAVEIESGVVEGRFPKRSLNLLLRWYDLHRDELCSNRERAQARRPLVQIAPLD